MKDKIIDKNSLDKVQKQTQKFARKNGKKAPKILCGILAATTPMLLLLSACGSENDGTSLPQSVGQRLNEVARIEKEFEVKLADYLSDVTGVDVKFVDVKTLQLVDKNLVFNGTMITDVKKGEETTSVTLELSGEQIESLKTYLEPTYYYSTPIVGNHGKVCLPGTDSTFSFSYEVGLVANLSDIINNSDTSVVSVYNHETLNFEYPVEND